MQKLGKFQEFFGYKKVIIGMVHLLPLPGSPHFAYNLSEIYERALKDLKNLEKGGANGAIIENFGDIPYMINNPIETYISMAHIVTLLKQETKIPLGVNIQFNCGKEEMAVAHLCGGDFVRIEAFTENRIGTHGVAYAQAPEVMRYKSKLKSKVLVFSDINVKHTYSLGIEDFFLNLDEAILAGADAIIVTGTTTGKEPEIKDVKEVKDAIGEFPLLIGSGVSADNIEKFLKIVDGVIVGTAIKEDSKTTNPISLEKVRMLAEIRDKCNS
ncbi:MAG TPA: BtpA/SgcQ family protein [Thermoanaerobacter sp.]|nr:BtpA/SgcQ family protein [Thermoanaerobacter sp.]